MKKVSIEYAHIYTNSKIDQEHQLSLDVLGKVREEESEKGNQVFLVIMIDDYSFPDPSFDYEGFSRWLGSSGHLPDAIIRESMLIPLCDEVLRLTEDPVIREQVTEYVRSKKYPCSLFIAAWYLLRLGCLNSSLMDEKFFADKLINILPRSFEPFEEKAFEIIRATKFADRASRIENRYFEGRLIA